MAIFRILLLLVSGGMVLFFIGLGIYALFFSKKRDKDGHEIDESWQEDQPPGWDEAPPPEKGDKDGDAKP